ncbi:MAG: DUF6786 family protein [Luteolibacter sp.]
MKNPLSNKVLLSGLAAVLALNTSLSAEEAASFAEDHAFIEKHTDAILLKKGEAAVSVVPAYQGRVMTSTFDAENGPSFGWINRPVIEKGFMSEEEAKGKLEQHIYIFGGEERFWLGPEGGQFAIFFKPGDEFEFADWKTPAAIDTEPFELVKKTDESAEFKKDFELMNFSGTKFSVGVERTVKILDTLDAEEGLGVKVAEGIKMVGYETDNRITNKGEKAWEPETGLLSIWMLGMYNPSPETTVVIPFKEGSEEELGTKVNDSYFGKVPADYLIVEDDILYFRGDGTHRGKIGLTPKRSEGIAGSYDATGKVLNIVTYNVQESPNGFVNSVWEMQEEPFAGDVINSYNDGSPAPGVAPLGPFYELETSSPAAALKPGETMKHIQRTYHFNGSEEDLNFLATELLGVGIAEITGKF